MKKPKRSGVNSLAGTNSANSLKGKGNTKDKKNISYLVHLYCLIRLINRPHCTTMWAIKGGQEDELY